MVPLPLSLGGVPCDLVSRVLAGDSPLHGTWVEPVVCKGQRVSGQRSDPTAWPLPEAAMHEVAKVWAHLLPALVLGMQSMSPTCPLREDMVGGEEAQP